MGTTIIDSYMINKQLLSTEYPRYSEEEILEYIVIYSEMRGFQAEFIYKIKKELDETKLE